MALLAPGSRFPNGVRVLVASAVLGVLVAAATVAFLAAAEAVTRVALAEGAGYDPGGPAGEVKQVPTAGAGPLRVWLLIPVATLGGLIVGWLTRRVAPEAAGAGTDAAVRAYHEPGGRVRGRVAVVKVLATAVTVGTGGSGGREGPMIQVGAGLGSWLAGRFGFGPAQRRVLIAAGVGAGVAAAFRTPLAGALFAAEVLYRSEDAEPDVLLPASVAAVAATAAAGPVLGWGPLLPAPASAFTTPLHLVAYALLAVALAGSARVYVAAFHRTRAWFGRLPLSPVVRPGVGAGLAALIGVGLYFAAGRDGRALAVLGFGLGTLQEALARPDAVAGGLLAAVALGKLVTTCLTVGSGGSGGVFGPALLIGGCGGAALGLAVQPLGPQWVPAPAAFALVGAAGLFAAAAKTPFSTLVIVCELTGDFGLVAPTLGVCVGSFLLSGRGTLFDSQPVSRADSPVRPAARSDRPGERSPAR